MFWVRVLEYFLVYVSDWFCEIEHLLSLIYLPHVIIIISNDIGNEVLSEPLIKDLLKEFGWESVSNQVNRIEKKYQNSWNSDVLGIPTVSGSSAVRYHKG